MALHHRYHLGACAMPIDRPYDRALNALLPGEWVWLNQLRHRPQDATLRGVFADWLEEHGLGGEADDERRWARIIDLLTPAERGLWGIAWMTADDRARDGRRRRRLSGSP